MIKKDGGTRYIDLEVEVPGTPENGVDGRRSARCST